jgi:hypothetical protein
MREEEMRRTTMLMTAIALCGGAAVAQQSAPAEGPPEWMGGCWIQEDGPKWTEECWTAPRAGTMLGSGRSGGGATITSWEANQMLPDSSGKLVYWASPHGGMRVAFPMVSRSATEIVFANPAHDYPQRIRYWRDGAALNAEISLLDGSRAVRWHYSAMR